MTLATVAVNGIAIEDYGLKAMNLDQWLSAPAVKFGTVQVVGRMGQTATIGGVSYAPRPLVLGVQTPGTTPAADRTALGAWLFAAQGRLEIETLDAPGRVCYGQFEQAPTTQFGVTFINGTALQSVGTITCHDPFWYDRSASTFGGAAATRILLPIGTAPSRLRVGICGPYTNPTLTLRDRTGSMIAQMRFTDTIGDATVYLDLNFGQLDVLNSQAADRYVSGVRSAKNNAFALLNASDTFFTVDPLDAPTIEVSSGSLSGIAWRGWLV